MWFLKFGARIFKKNSLLNFLIIIQLIIVILLLTSLALFLENQSIEFNISKRLLSSNGGFFVLYSKDILENINTEKLLLDDITIENLAKKYIDEIDICRVAYTNVDIDGKKVLLQGVDKNFFDLLDMPIAHGKYFSKTKAEKNCINALSSFGKENNEYLMKYGNSEYSIKLKTVGIMPNPYAYFDLGGTANTLSIVFFWRKIGLDEPVIICDLEELHTYNINYHYKSCNLILIKENVPQARAKEIKTDFGTIGMYNDLSEIASNSKKQSYEILKPLIPLIIIIGIIALINFAIAVALSSAKSLRDIAIMYICGAKKKDAYKTILAYGGLISVIVVIPSILMNYLLPSMKFILRGRLSFGILTTIILSVSAIFLGTTFLISALTLKQQNIAKILRSE